MALRAVRGKRALSGGNFAGQASRCTMAVQAGEEMGAARREPALIIYARELAKASASGPSLEM